MLLYFWWLAWKRRLVYLTVQTDAQYCGLIQWATPNWVCLRASGVRKEEFVIILSTKRLISVQEASGRWLDDLFSDSTADEPPPPPAPAGVRA